VWIDAAQLTEGPVVRRIDAHGHLGLTALHPNSLVPVLRHCFAAAGVPEPDRYSGHSLRRGFATWASAHQWNVKDLMEYVGWQDPASALRYIERDDACGRRRIEQGLAVDASAGI